MYLIGLRRIISHFFFLLVQRQRRVCVLQFSYISTSSSKFLINILNYDLLVREIHSKGHIAAAHGKDRHWLIFKSTCMPWVDYIILYLIWLMCNIHSDETCMLLFSCSQWICVSNQRVKLWSIRYVEAPLCNSYH